MRGMRYAWSLTLLKRMSYVGNLLASIGGAFRWIGNNTEFLEKWYPVAIYVGATNFPQALSALTQHRLSLAYFVRRVGLCVQSRLYFGPDKTGGVEAAIHVTSKTLG